MTFSRPGFLAYHETEQRDGRTETTGGITFRLYSPNGADVTLNAEDVKALGEYIAH